MTRQLHEATGEQLSEPRTARAQDKVRPTQAAMQRIKQRHLRRHRYVKTSPKVLALIGSMSDTCQLEAVARPTWRRMAFLPSTINAAVCM
jgi:hypothetical protein